MPNLTAVRFAVVKQGTPRCILSIAEMKGGDLILNLRANHLSHATGIPFGAGIDDRGDPIKEYRYTIHMSPDSKVGINTIKLHHDLENGTTLTAIQYTAAIKQTNSFAPIYARYCSALHDHRYDIKKINGRYESLGDLNNEFTLVFAVFVGPTDRLFSAVGSYFQYRQVKFKEFSVVMLWSFLTAPPHDHSRLMHATTTKGYSQSRGYSAKNALAYSIPSAQG
jgi:hypothetical protein